MKKEFYKLILVAIMIVFAFSLGFFLGREVTLANPPPKGPKNPNEVPSQALKHSPPRAQQKQTAQTPPANPPTNPKTQHERVNQYKQNHLNRRGGTRGADPARPDVGGDKSPKNKANTQKKKEKPSKTLYALRIKSHKNRGEAIRQSTDLKLRFPRWRFFFTQTGANYTVYIGPFKFKRSAQSILRKLKTKKGFASARIEKL